MANNYDTEFSVSRDGNDNVRIVNENSQTFSAEDFVQVYKDTKQNLQNLYQKYDSMQEEMQEMLDEKEEAMQVIHTLVESEPQDEAELEANSLTLDDLNAFLQLQHKNGQVDQTVRQIEQVEDQLLAMYDVAEQISEDVKPPEIRDEL